MPFEEFDGANAISPAYELADLVERAKRRKSKTVRVDAAVADHVLMQLSAAQSAVGVVAAILNRRLPAGKEQACKRLRRARKIVKQALETRKGPPPPEGMTARRAPGANPRDLAFPPPPR